MGWRWVTPQDKLASISWCVCSWKEAWVLPVNFNSEICIWFCGFFLLVFFLVIPPALPFFFPLLCPLYVLPSCPCIFFSLFYSIPPFLHFYFSSCLSPSFPFSFLFCFLLFLVFSCFWSFPFLLLHPSHKSPSHLPSFLPLFLSLPPIFSSQFTLFLLSLSLFLGVSLYCLSRDITSDASSISPKPKASLGIWNETSRWLSLDKNLHLTPWLLLSPARGSHLTGLALLWAGWSNELDIPVFTPLTFLAKLKINKKNFHLLYRWSPS